MSVPADDEIVSRCKHDNHTHGGLTPAALGNLRLCTANLVIFQRTGVVHQERLASVSRGVCDAIADGNVYFARLSHVHSRAVGVSQPGFGKRVAAGRFTSWAARHAGEAVASASIFHCFAGTKARHGRAIFQRDGNSGLVARLQSGLSADTQGRSSSATEMETLWCPGAPCPPGKGMFQPDGDAAGPEEQPAQTIPSGQQ
jgi:hypothetical protein